MRAAQTRYLILAVALGASCRQVLDIEPARIGEVSTPGGAPTAAGAANAGTSGSAGSGSSSAPEGGDGGAPASDAEPPAGGTGATADGAGGDSGGAGGGELPLCERYCATLAANCTGDLAQYSDQQTCIDTCSILPAGAASDTNVNTVECRLAEAEKAGRLEPDFYCPLAGPVGGGKCGTDCEGFCQIMASFCTAERTNGAYYYADIATCLAECQTVPVGPTPYSAPLYTVGPYLQCRIFHACAADIDADYHCGHAFGEAPCTEVDGGA